MQYAGITHLEELQLHEMFIEYKRASKLFHNFHSPHEGYAVILEELDELWDEIRNGEDKEKMKREAIQVGAMALRFIINVCEGENMKVWWVNTLDMKDIPDDTRDTAMVKYDEAQMEIEAIRKVYVELKTAIRGNCADNIQVKDE